MHKETISGAGVHGKCQREREREGWEKRTTDLSGATIGETTLHANKGSVGICWGMWLGSASVWKVDKATGIRWLSGSLKVS